MQISRPRGRHFVGVCVSGSVPVTCVSEWVQSSHSKSNLLLQANILSQYIEINNAVEKEVKFQQNYRKSWCKQICY